MGRKMNSGNEKPSAWAWTPWHQVVRAMRLALECRRRVKEQQKRIGTAEFRNTRFSYSVGLDGVEKFVVTPSYSPRTGSAPIRCHMARRVRSAPVARARRRIEVNEGAGRRCAHPEPVTARAVFSKACGSPSRTSTPAAPSWSVTVIRASTNWPFSCVRSRPPGQPMPMLISTGPPSLGGSSQ
jgi:hypothetical protein